MGSFEASRSPGSLILAAGSSSRFGKKNKLLQSIDGEPMIRHSVQTHLEAETDLVLVVLGHEVQAVAKTLQDLPVHLIFNPNYREGQSSSLRVGINTLKEMGRPAVVIGLGDMPFLNVSTVNDLIGTYQWLNSPGIVIPVYNGHRGNPVLFDGRYYPELMTIEGDKGARNLLEAPDAHRIEVEDPGIRTDVNAPDDLPD